VTTEHHSSFLWLETVLVACVYKSKLQLHSRTPLPLRVRVPLAIAFARTLFPPNGSFPYLDVVWVRRCGAAHVVPGEGPDDLRRGGRVRHPRDPIYVLSHAPRVDMLKAVLPQRTPAQRAVAYLVGVATP